MGDKRENILTALKNFNDALHALHYNINTCILIILTIESLKQLLLSGTKYVRAQQFTKTNSRHRGAGLPDNFYHKKPNANKKEPRKNLIYFSAKFAKNLALSDKIMQYC